MQRYRNMKVENLIINHIDAKENNNQTNVSTEMATNTRFEPPATEIYLIGI